MALRRGRGAGQCYQAPSWERGLGSGTSRARIRWHQLHFPPGGGGPTFPALPKKYRYPRLNSLEFTTHVEGLEGRRGGVVNPTPGDRVMLSSCCHPPSLLSSLASCEMATEYEVQPKHEHETGRRVHLRVKSGDRGCRTATRLLSFKVRIQSG